MSNEQYMVTGIRTDNQQPVTGYLIYIGEKWSLIRPEQTLHNFNSGVMFAPDTFQTHAYRVYPDSIKRAAKVVERYRVGQKGDSFKGVRFGYCPSCGKMFMIDICFDLPNFCEKCGQALEWPVENEVTQT